MPRYNEVGMGLHRFFVVHGLSRESSTVEVNDPQLFHQLKSVLRLKPGDRVILLDNTGFEYEAEIMSFSNHGAEFHILSQRKSAGEPRRNVTLYQALPKKLSLFELVLQKGTEVGVKTFVPLITERTERKEISKITRLSRVLQEAAEQSGRGMIPKLLSPTTFNECLELVKDKARQPRVFAVLFDPHGEMLQKPRGDLEECHIFVGPEGGFTKKELLETKSYGIKVVTAGSRILRTETAGMVLPALFLL